MCTEKSKPRNKKKCLLDQNVRDPNDQILPPENDNYPVQKLADKETNGANKLMKFSGVLEHIYGAF